MHTIWKGAIAFGLVNVPVKLHSATEEQDISFKYVHRDCGSHLNYVRSCPSCEREAEWDSIIKGYEYEKGKYVLFEKEELEQILPESSKEIRVLHFADPGEISPLYFQKTYYLAPDTIGLNGYQMLTRVMLETDKIAICKVSIRSKHNLAAIRVVDGCLTLTTMFYPEEIRSVEALPHLKQESKMDAKGLELARMLIAHMSKSFTASEYINESKEQLISAIQRKIAGEEIKVQPAYAGAPVIDLMAALQASLEALKSADEKKPAKKKKKSGITPSGTGTSSTTETA